jgi:hypothetical protein
MKKTIIILVSFSAFFLCCEKKIKSEKGSIDLISNVYYNASHNLDDVQSFYIAKINYNRDNLIELVPNVLLPEMIDQVYFIKDTVYYDGGSLENAKSLVFDEIIRKQTPKSIYRKEKGAVWVKIPIYDYDKRKNLTDTVLYGNKKFKRFEINTKDNYSCFYITPTDTLLPYSLNTIADKDYGGRLERIDSYDKQKDLFATLILVPKKNWDYEAKSIFEFNEYTKNKKK